MVAFPTQQAVIFKRIGSFRNQVRDVISSGYGWFPGAAQPETCISGDCKACGSKEALVLFVLPVTLW